MPDVPEYKPPGLLKRAYNRVAHQFAQIGVDHGPAYEVLPAPTADEFDISDQGAPE